MAHWAELDSDNQVIRVLVGDNNDPNGDEGYQWLIDNLGGRWIQTSYNNNFRKQYAGQGYFYDETLDIFIAPQPFPSWTLDSNHDWQPPTPRPQGDQWVWNESKGDWVSATQS